MTRPVPLSGAAACRAAVNAKPMEKVDHPEQGDDIGRWPEQAREAVSDRGGDRRRRVTRRCRSARGEYGGHSFWVYCAPFFLAGGALLLGIPSTWRSADT